MKKYLTIILAAVCMAGCIDPIELTPDIEGEITAFEVEGQVRPASINPSTRTVNIVLGDGVDLRAVKVLSIGLVQTATCDVAAGSVLDLTKPLKVTVSTAADYEWTITATNGSEERRALPGGDFEQWHRADISGKPNPAGNVWNPWPEGATLGWDRWWDTGNEGVAMLGASNSVPTEPGEGSPANPAGRAARLESKYVVFKAAGGNIYFGEFGKLTGLDATCRIGHNWQTKPTGLKGWYKYFPQPVDTVSDEYVGLHPFGLTKQQWLGSMDSLHVCVALWASPDGENIPFTVDSTPATFVDFNRDQSGVLAYGAFISGREQVEWDEFTVELEYFVDKDEPLPDNTQLYVSVTSSKNCNYFIAGTGWKGTVASSDDTPGSLMYVDELELVYE